MTLDEYPIHQAPLSMEFVASSDRNFYDRCYFNAHDRTGDIFLITGLGVYPNLGVIDAYAVVRRGDEQFSVRFSDALESRSLDARVGPYRVEVIEPLRRIRLACDGDEHGIGFDLTWDGSFPPIGEQPHVLLTGNRTTLDASRFAQLGSWSGTLTSAGSTLSGRPRTSGWARATGPGASGRLASRAPAGRAGDEPGRRASGGSTCRSASTTSR